MPKIYKTKHCGVKEHELFNKCYDENFLVRTAQTNTFFDKKKNLFSHDPLVWHFLFGFPLLDFDYSNFFFLSFQIRAFYFIQQVSSIFLYPLPRISSLFIIYIDSNMSRTIFTRSPSFWHLNENIVYSSMYIFQILLAENTSAGRRLQPFVLAGTS